MAWMFNSPKQMPFRIARLHISELKVQASVSKIQSRPIRLLIDEVIVELEEPSVVLPPRNGAKPPGPPGIRSR